MYRFAYPLGKSEKSLPLYVSSVGEEFDEQKSGPAPHFQCYYQLLYTCKGCGYVKLRDYEGELPKGCGFLLSPYEPREYFPATDEPWHTAWITFGGDFAEPMLSLIPDKHTSIFTLTNQALIRKKMNAIRRVNSGSSWVEDTSYLLYDFLLNLKYCISFEHKDSMYSVYKKRLEPLIEHFEQNFTQPLDLTMAAEIVGISVTHLCNIFRRVYHMRPNEYVTMLRLENARNLLVSKPHLTVNEIGRRSGYEDASYFSKKFKEQNGVTPGEFRENYVQLTSHGIKENEVPSSVLGMMKQGALFYNEKKTNN